MLKFQFFGPQHGATPQICSWRFRPDPRDGLRTPFTKILQQRLNECLAEHVTSTLRIPAEVSRRPLLELPVLLSLDDLIGHYVSACFVGATYRIFGREARDVRSRSDVRRGTRVQSLASPWSDEKAP